MKKILLLLSFSVSLFVHAQTGPYAFYPFNGNANDASGNNHHGILHGNPTLTADRFGNANSAYLFDGVDDYIEMPEAFDFKPRTISLWFKSMSFSTEGVVFSSDNINTLYGDSKIVANESGGSYTLNLKIGANSYVQTLNINQWYHASLVYSDTAVKYYVNGGLVGTFNNLINNHSGNGVMYATVGCHRTLINYFHGVIDDVVVNDRALTEAEIAGVYSSIEDNIQPALFSCFPNPANEQLHILTEIPLKVSIVDMQGNILSATAISGNNDLDLSSLASGVYCVSAEDKLSGAVTRKLIIKQ